MTSCALKAIPIPADLRRVSRGRPFGGPMMAPPACRYADNTEPHLDDLVGDPIVLRLMARDGVSPEALATLIEQVRVTLRPL